MSDTIFDKILSKEMDADIVYEDQWSLAFRDISPQAPVHILVIPKKKMQNFNDLPVQDTDFLGNFLKSVSTVAQKEAPGGYRIVFNTGVHGQQTVDYIHAHILGGRQLRWPPG